jgi:hypothetical protein
MANDEQRRVLHRLAILQQLFMGGVKVGAIVGMPWAAEYSPKKQTAIR